ncbi:MAG: hypothetical protein VW274_06930 [Thalassolituus sp.]
MKRSALALSVVLATLSTHALEITSVDSVYDTSRVSQDLLIPSDTIDGVTYESQLTGGAHRAAYDVSAKTVAEAAAALEQSGIYPAGYFSNYPVLPTTQAARDQLTAEGVALTDAAYKAHVDSLVASIRYTGLEAYSDANLSFQGANDTTLILHDISNGSEFACDRATFDAKVAPAQQTGSCAIVATDSFDRKFYNFATVSFKNDILLTDYQGYLTAYYGGNEYTLPITRGGANDYLINNSTTPLISGRFMGTDTVYRLNADGTVSTLVFPGIPTGENTYIQLNDKYMLVLDGYAEGTTTDGYCEYTINGNEVTCTSAMLPLPYDVAKTDADPDEFVGYSPYVALGYDSEIMGAFFGYEGVSVMPVLHDLVTGEYTSLTQPVIENLNTVLGADYVSAVRTTLTDMFLSDFAGNKYPGMSAELEADVIEDVVAKVAVTGYAEFAATGDAAAAAQNANPAYITDLFLMTATETQYIGNGVIKTPIAKYTITRAAAPVEVQVNLPNVMGQSGVEMVLVNSEGERSVITSNEDGTFAIESTGDGVYQVSLSYPNHVFECATIDLNSEEIQDLSLLAGDLNNDGYIDAFDSVIFTFRFFFRGVDADVNNDGVVNNSDLTMILQNQGAVQCDL